MTAAIPESTNSYAERRAVEIADKVVPAYRADGVRYSCTGQVARCWQAACDGALEALPPIPAQCSLVSRKIDDDCGCPEEEWETPWGYLFMHLNAGKPSDAYLDRGDEGERSTAILALSVDGARDAIFSWASSVEGGR